VSILERITQNWCIDEPYVLFQDGARTGVMHLICETGYRHNDTEYLRNFSQEYRIVKKLLKYEEMKLPQTANRHFLQHSAYAAGCSPT
jgi:hypothetical protein